MGMHDRDWYREWWKARREHEGDGATKMTGSENSLVSVLFRTVVNCLAIYGATNLLIRAIRAYKGLP